MRFVKSKLWSKLLLMAGVLALFTLKIFGQQIQWAKRYALPKPDAIFCVAKDSSGNIYAGGSTDRNIPGTPWTVYHMGFLMKLTPNGDTLFTQEIGYGTIFSMVVDFEENIRINLFSESKNPFFDKLLILIKMQPDGFVLRRDTIQPVPNGMYPFSSIVGKDSSLIVVGRTPRPSNPSQTSMFFLRVQKNGSVDPWVELNPGHPNCGANRVEQLPNGNYLVSGYVGSRIASYELDSLGLNPQFRQWYQTPNFLNFTSGYLSQAPNKSWAMAGETGPTRVAYLDSSQNKIWMHEQTSILYPPQVMTDGNIVYGFNKNTVPYNVFFKRQKDSTTTWFFNLSDSLSNRGIGGDVLVGGYFYFPDSSGLFAGTIYQGNSLFDRDPFFIKIAKVGIPVTSLSKPTQGTLANETLAPWPNPTGGTLYLKQHFDKAEIRLYNLAGKEMGQYQIRFGQAIDISLYSQGIYFYRAVIDGKHYSGKIIKR